MNPGRWHRVTEVFHEALAHEAEDRRAFISASCQDDPSIREDVETLIAAHESAAFLDETLAVGSSMPRLEPGTLHGAYRIEEWIGAGAMGEVYRATDLNLGRDVALKMLPPAFARDPDRVSRFHREAQLLAALNHPHIAQIHGLETIYGVATLVMEMVEGVTLAERLSQAPIAIDEALSIASQLADALDTAHQQGIIHRDLKPANIKLTPEGAVKVLDFGLAKAIEASPALSPKVRPGAASPSTRQGVILGTVAYMAPEQARGKKVDKRADIWAFGAVVFEMLSGRHAFAGESLADTLAAVLDREPDWKRLPANVPAGIRQWLQRCLEKNPRHRTRDIGDVWLELERPTTPSAGDAPPHPSSRRRLAWTMVAIAAAGLAGGALGAASWWRSPSLPASVPTAVVRFTLPVEPAPNPRFGAGLTTRLALSRDGRRLAYVSERADRTPIIYLRQLESETTTALAGTEGAIGVFFSPNGEQLGFFAAGKLKKISVRGGLVVTLCDAVQGAGATWSEQDTIVFAPTSLSALMRVSARGGTPQPITALARAEVSHRWPEFLPGGTHFLFTASEGSDFDNARIVIQSIVTGERVELTDGTYPRFSETGHVLFAREANLFALPFDAVNLKARGPATPIVTDLRINSSAGSALFAVARGVLVYRPITATFVPRVMAWVDAAGTEEVIPIEARPFLQPRLSPDGGRVAVTIGEQRTDRDVWIYDFVHGALAPLTVEAGEEESAVWNADGSRLAISANKEGELRTILTLPSDGKGRPESLLSASHPIHVSDWSPDGRTLLWTEFDPVSGGRIRSGPADGSGPAQSLTDSPFDVRGAVFSPDGGWIAYTSNESGRDEIYVQPHPGPGLKRRVSVAGGREPVWARRGGTLYFRGPERVMSVDITTSPTFTKGLPRPLFLDRYESEHNGDRNYDVTADGRFLMLRPAQPFPAAELSVILNWQATLGVRE
jgi:serine/threonine protein kinase/Tol biopolymer transport system component